jgi:hypothetical protein
MFIFKKKSCLVGGFNPSEKYESQWVSDDIPYMKWKITHVPWIPNHQPNEFNHPIIFNVDYFMG